MFGRNRSRSIMVALCFVLILVFDFFGWLAPVKSLALQASSPVVALVSSGAGKVKAAFSILFSLKRQLDEAQAMQAELRQLRNEKAGLQAILAENQRLRKMLGVKQEMPLTTIGAHVVSRDPTGLVSAAVIDRGKDSGISAGDAVLDGSGALLGVISEVHSDNAKFTLLTDGSMKVDAKVPGKSALGVVSGSHGLGLSFDLISQEVQIASGDPVLTSGLTGFFPAGINIGTVDIENKNRSELFQRIVVSPAANFKDFTFVLVVTAF